MGPMTLRIALAHGLVIALLTAFFAGAFASFRLPNPVRPSTATVQTVVDDHAEHRKNCHCLRCDGPKNCCCVVRGKTAPLALRALCDDAAGVIAIITPSSILPPQTRIARSAPTLVIPVPVGTTSPRAASRCPDPVFPPPRPLS
jgi:hypothetical protein